MDNAHILKVLSEMHIEHSTDPKTLYLATAPDFAHSHTHFRERNELQACLYNNAWANSDPWIREIALHEQRAKYKADLMTRGMPEGQAQFLAVLYMSDTGTSIISDPALYISSHTSALIAFMSVASPGLQEDFFRILEDSISTAT